MTLKQWNENGWLRPHKTSRQEISNLLAIVHRDLTDAAYLETCRAKRNIVEYDYVGGATSANADELIESVESLKKNVLEWLHSCHPDLMPDK